MSFFCDPHSITLCTNHFKSQEEIKDYENRNRKSHTVSVQKVVFTSCWFIGVILVKIRNYEGM